MLWNSVARGALKAVSWSPELPAVWIDPSADCSSFDEVKHHWGTASRPETTQWCIRHGAHAVIDHTKSMTEPLKQIGAPPVRHVAGLNATEQHFPALVELLAPQGKIVVIDDPKILDVKPLKRKAAALCWESMLTRSLYGTEDMIAQHNIFHEAADLVEKGVHLYSVPPTLLLNRFDNEAEISKTVITWEKRARRMVSKRTTRGEFMPETSSTTVFDRGRQMASGRRSSTDGCFYFTANQLQRQAGFMKA